MFELGAVSLDWRPRIFAEMERMVPRLPLDAERWIGEMHEIAGDENRGNIMK